MGVSEPTCVPATGAENVKLLARLATYSQWPTSSKLSSEQLACAGFIYTGIGDKVECQTCGIWLYNWEKDKDPFHAHRRYAPGCEFMATNFPQIKAPPKRKKTFPVKYTQYADYQARLRSFDSWPLKCVAQKPEMMARSGFFYVGTADRACCFCCGVILRDWDADDHPPSEHRQWSQDCPFAQQLDVEALEAEIKRSKNERSTRADGSQEHPQMDTLHQRKSPYIHRSSGEEHLFADYQTRLRTYTSWPKEHVAQRPEMMARSGFYYLGSGDRVRCFLCGLTICNWDSSDYPPAAHRQWSEHCPFVQRLDVQAMRGEIERSKREATSTRRCEPRDSGPAGSPEGASTEDSRGAPRTNRRRRQAAVQIPVQFSTSPDSINDGEIFKNSHDSGCCESSTNSDFTD